MKNRLAGKLYIVKLNDYIFCIKIETRTCINKSCKETGTICSWADYVSLSTFKKKKLSKNQINWLTIAWKQHVDRE